MITFKVKLCPFGGGNTVMTKTSPVEYPPQLGSFVTDGSIKSRVAQIDFDIKSLMHTVHLADYKGAKVPLEAVVKELTELGWGIEKKA